MQAADLLPQLADQLGISILVDHSLADNLFCAVRVSVDANIEFYRQLAICAMLYY